MTFTKGTRKGAFPHLPKAERLHYVWLGAIVFAALLLRLVQIEREPLWADEAITLLIKQWPTTDLLFRSFDPSPGLYYLLAKWFVPNGAGVAAVRAMPVLFGVASVVVMYVVGRLAFTPRWGLVSAAMLAASPAMVDYSQEGRAYSLLLLLVLLSAAGLLLWVRDLGAGRTAGGALLLFSLSTVLAFYTHFTSVFWILPAVIGGREITDRLGHRTARRAYIAASVGMVIAALPEILRIVLRLYPRAGLEGLGFLRNVDFYGFLAATGDTLLPSALWNDAEGAAGGTSAAILSLIFLYAAVHLWLARTNVRAWASDNPAAPLVMGTLLVLPLFVWLFSHAVTPIFMPRSILLGVPGFILLLVLTSRMERHPLSWAVFIAGSAAALAVNGTVRAKELWGPVADHLQARMRPGDAILVCPDWRAPSLLHALGGAAGHPVFLVQGSDILLMAPHLNGAGWEEAYSRPVTWRIIQSGIDGPPVPMPRRPIQTPARFWIVQSGCSPDQKQLLGQWLGQGSQSQSLRFSGGRFHSGIELSLFEGRLRRATVLSPQIPTDQ